jgi:hypothetical protein
MRIASHLEPLAAESIEADATRTTAAGSMPAACGLAHPDTSA